MKAFPAWSTRGNGCACATPAAGRAETVRIRPVGNASCPASEIHRGLHRQEESFRLHESAAVGIHAGAFEARPVSIRVESDSLPIGGPVGAAILNSSLVSCRSSEPSDETA